MTINPAAAFAFALSGVAIVALVVIAWSVALIASELGRFTSLALMLIQKSVPSHPAAPPTYPLPTYSNPEAKPGDTDPLDAADDIDPEAYLPPSDKWHE
jgi:hypothetical protein